MKLPFAAWWHPTWTGGAGGLHEVFSAHAHRSLNHPAEPPWEPLGNPSYSESERELYQRAERVVVPCVCLGAVGLGLAPLLSVRWIPGWLLALVCGSVYTNSGQKQSIKSVLCVWWQLLLYPRFQNATCFCVKKHTQSLSERPNVSLNTSDSYEAKRKMLQKLQDSYVFLCILIHFPW